MDWLMVNSQAQGTFPRLGSKVGDAYVPSDNCLEILNEMLQKISVEDRTLRTLRRSIGFSQVVKKEILPLLINVKDDRKIIDTSIKVLTNLTMPVECLLPIEVMSKTEAGRNTINELNWLLISSKEAFLEPRATRRIVDHIKDILYKGDELKEEDCETLNDSIVLLRNILHIPNGILIGGEGFSEQNQILWNLFAQNFDKVLIELLTVHGRDDWRTSIAQLIVLLYKDQRVPTLQKFLTLWFESSELSESSEDNESNTSPPGGNSSSSMITSDPTDSSDNSGCDHKPEMKQSGKRKQSIKQQTSKKRDTWDMWIDGDQQMEHSQMSDCGYGTLAENQESISTSSNEDDSLNNRVVKPVHQKPSNMIQKSRFLNGKTQLSQQDKAELKRKKLLKRFRTNIVNIKALLHHTPTEDDITHILKEFTVDFLLKAFGTVITELRQQLMMNQSLDRTHFFWLISYFLKFAVQLEIDLQHIRDVLSLDLISFLTYEGANLCEQFELVKTQTEYDFSPYLIKIHLIVTSIRELLQAISAYKKIKHNNWQDNEYLDNIHRAISETEDLRCLFVLLLRQFNPTIHSKQYLRDIIVTNHILLTFIENSLLPGSNAVLQNHMKLFVPVEMMRQYGYLLEYFEENGNFVNDCVFTMMHHVAGDLEHVTALFQPTILKTFSVIWESEFQICDDWADLIEFVIHKFINTPRSIPLILHSKEVDVPPSNHQKNEWNQENCDNLYWYYIQSANCVDPIGKVINLYTEAGICDKTRIGVIEQLLKQDVINGLQYNELMKKEPIITNVKVENMKELPQSKDEIELLKEHLIKEEKVGVGFITWLQKVLLETCYAKLFLHKKSNHTLEPVPHYSTILKEPVPIVAWSCEQKGFMQSQVFLLLLHKLGLHLPVDAGKVFARIPSNWSPQTLYETATRLGPIRKDWKKFDINTLNINHDSSDDNLNVKTEKEL